MSCNKMRCYTHLVSFENSVCKLFSTECIKQLKEMFPDVEEEKLLETLRSNDYSSEDPISELLGLSEVPGCGNEGQIFKE